MFYCSWERLLPALGTCTTENAMDTPKPNKLEARRRRLARIAAAALVGIALGEICPLLPPAAQAVCHIAAKVLAVFGGSP